ncbi:FAD linked oxidase domain protein [Gluconacetobacter diazotrophicus PA1 5]|uniref:Putative glycolate oxidase subunit n=1 Tax=Gluconacetobacter diazotrophicus (strain ATCC 49037 / DSM 5601 / CCUG 37298 / CIP 103539 / LMG 7603 / PAl5) TaxID=272568 RepID=A9HAG4_GLUDA|nr:FAD-binding protein [Gluconacetobacter diazotrophicus]ACI51049.1 FAD linked oxidase domain protein [Gluconacetobacter diazotrophicus PA1 5]TWB00970.1 glycolate oxidase FAD binding subunit [Gluconacetobacter diazotrophicus]CAP54688.1 putative glycolate oxidase subunit [Gluconacetobacter diazotrophicus PA1 5]
MSILADPIVYRPTRAPDVAEMVRAACSKGQALAIAGNGTRHGLGNPVAAAVRLEVGGLRTVHFYEPDDLVIRVDAGLPLAELTAILAEHRQYLPFEPPVHAVLYGTDPARATIGGAIGTGLSGPRRFQAGAARDFVLGVEGVNGQGDSFSAGGRTMKNVTGYDLPKLVTGAFGTLAVLTSVTLKVLPAPPEERTLLLPSAGLAGDIARMATVLAQPLAVTGAAVVPDGDGRVIALRVEGSRPAVTDHMGRLADPVSGLPPGRMLEGPASTAFWTGVRELVPLAAGPDDWLWRIHLPATAAAGLADRLRGEGLVASLMLDWGGALLFCAMKPGREDSVTRLRALAAAVAGRAILIRAPDAVRAAHGAFPAPDPAVRALSERTRRVFDPAGILNPGRMTPPAQEDAAC